MNERLCRVAQVGGGWWVVLGAIVGGGAGCGCQLLVGHCVARCVSARHQNPHKRVQKVGEKI